MSRVMLVQGLESILADPAARLGLANDILALDRMLQPRAAASAPPPVTGELAAPAKAAALLIRRKDGRGGWFFALWHDGRPSQALADEIRQGFVEAFPLTAEVAALGLDGAVGHVFGGAARD